MTARHKRAGNPLRWIPVLTLAGLAVIGSVSVSAYSTPSTPHSAPSLPVSAPASIPFTKPLPVIQVPQKAAQTYTVRRGDTMWSVAAAHCGTGTADTALASANHISLSSVISPGQVIILTC